jgi:hypothetical protein
MTPTFRTLLGATVMTDADLLAWIETLVYRGVSLRASGRTVQFTPKSAYGAMTNEERAFHKSHKSRITEILREQYGGEVQGIETPLTVPQHSQPEAPPQPCAYCHKLPADCAEMRTACPEAFATLYYDTPEQVEERRRRATEVMMR